MANPLLTMLIRPAMRRRNARKLALGSRTGLYEARFVDIGGIPQWITIREQDRRNPVLLFLHGGPGSPYTPFNSWLLEWEQHFTIALRKTGRRLGEELEEARGRRARTRPQIASYGCIRDWQKRAHAVPGETRAAPLWRSGSVTRAPEAPRLCGKGCWEPMQGRMV